MTRANQRIRQFGHDTRGNIAIIFALSAIPVFGITALAVDYGRAITAKSQLQNATDAAALTAVRLTGGTEQDRILAAQKSFAANYKPYGHSVVAPSVVFTGGTVQVTAADAVPTSIAGLAGYPEFSVASQSKATMTSGKHLELSMMIDLTGSMSQTRNGVSKMTGLKDAAEDLLDILYPNGAMTSDSVRVAVAPFADYVNAGQWASIATGLPQTGGSYANISNLASTRQSPFPGQYTGAIMNQSGSQAGATPISTTYPGQISAAGTTFTNGYCAEPTTTTTTAAMQLAGRDGGVKITLNPSCSGHHCNNPSYFSGAAPTGVLKTASGINYSRINEYWGNAWQYWNGNSDQAPQSASGYFVPLVQSTASLTIQTRAADDSQGNFHNGDVGIAVWWDGQGTRPDQIKRNTNGFWHVSINSDGSYRYSWQQSTNNTNSQSYAYVPLYTSLTTTGAVSGCEAPVVTRPQSQLIGCVTERTGAEAYTDVSPTAAIVGRFNNGSSAISNYSSDGACWVSGRKLPSIIPLTDSRSTLNDFFANATPGGATPGHIGTAWSWYMLSPEWNNVWPSNAATAYGTANVLKVAVLMTDGEYNIHYASPSARDQALALCTAMKAKGITVYTVGFGFAESTVANASGTTEQRAKDLMQRCASNSSTYFFPYDGEQLRRDFKAIGALLMGEMQSDTAKLLD